MGKRTDHHAPSSPDFDPESYEFIDVIDNDPDDAIGAAAANKAVREYVNRAYLDNGYRYAGNPFQCTHCGATIRYAAILSRPVSLELIYVGQDCLSNRFESMTKDAFRRAQKRAAESRAQHRIKHAIHDTVDAHPLLAELTYPGNPLFTGDFYNEFLCSIAHKFRTYGELTERQISAVERTIPARVKYVDKVTETQRKRDAERDALLASGVTYPEGRETVTGTVVSVKEHENDYGVTWKMTVADDRGFKVWCTVPSSIVMNVEKGARVQFDATLTVSDDDPLFGFGKRPSKASIL